jgi:hypothetical protein
MGVIFIDERVLADSYDKYSRKIYYSDKVEKVVQGERVELPPMKLRKEISKELQQEVNQMNEKELLANMKEIKKEELEIFNSKDLGYYNRQYMDWILSVVMMKVDRKSLYKRKKEKNLLDKYDYKSIEDINLHKNKKYIYIN